MTEGVSGRSSPGLLFDMRKRDRAQLDRGTLCRDLPSHKIAIGQNRENHGGADRPDRTNDCGPPVVLDACGANACRITGKRLSRESHEIDGAGG